MKSRTELECDRHSLGEARELRKTELDAALSQPEHDPEEIRMLRLMVNGLSAELEAVELELSVLASTPIPPPRRQAFVGGRFVPVSSPKED